jgi:arginase
MQLAVIGVPYTSSGRTDGEARAPSVVRAAGLLDALAVESDVVDYGDVPVPSATSDRDPETGIIAPAALAGMIDTVSSSVRRALDEPRLPLVIGGECPLLLGCLEAARAEFGRIGLLFVDGHEDAWTPQQSTTGEAADVELGFVLGLTHATGMPDLEARLPLVQLEDTVVLGPRDGMELVEAGVPSLAEAVAFLDDIQLRNGDLDTTARTLAGRLHARPGHWWFHLDLDVLSTEAMPAVRYPQPGGLDWSDLTVLTAATLQTPGIVGWDITIYNPDLDADGRGAARIVSFVGEMSKYLV